MLLELAVASPAALLAGAEAAPTTGDTAFGDPLDTVEDIVGVPGGQLVAALAVVGAAIV